MSPTQILALIRDIAILAALGFLVYLLISYGERRVTIDDLKAVQTQIEANAKTEAKWQQERTDAEHQRDVDMADIRGRIAAQSSPIIVRVPTSSGAVPTAPAKAIGDNPGSGSADQGSGSRTCDVRPAVNAVELKYEDALSQCREALASWPQ